LHFKGKAPDNGRLSSIQPHGYPTNSDGLHHEQLALIDARPLPEYGNLIGALQILRKTETELSAGTPPEIAAINTRFETIQTRGDARAYVASVMEKVGIAREQRKLAASRAR